MADLGAKIAAFKADMDERFAQLEALVKEPEPEPDAAIEDDLEARIQKAFNRDLFDSLTDEPQTIQELMNSGAPPLPDQIRDALPFMEFMGWAEREDRADDGRFTEPRWKIGWRHHVMAAMYAGYDLGKANAE